jgi:hypothetical protein
VPLDIRLERRSASNGQNRSSNYLGNLTSPAHKSEAGKKESTDRHPQPTLPAVRHAIVDLNHAFKPSTMSVLPNLDRHAAAA